MLTRLLLASSFAIAASIAGWAAYPHSTTVQWQGYAEADYVKVGPTQQGMLTTVQVARGDRVYPGRPLFTQDDLLDLAAHDQAKQRLEQASRQLANLLARGDLPRSNRLMQTWPTRKPRANDAARISGGPRRWRSSMPPRLPIWTNPAPIFSRQKQKDMPAKRHLRSRAYRPAATRRSRPKRPWSRPPGPLWRWPSGGSRSAASLPALKGSSPTCLRPGETLDAGAPVISILPPKNVFVRFFVNESELASIHYGDEVELAFDHCPGGFLTATVQFISPQAEYTPPVIYSEETRAKLVFRIEARPRPTRPPCSTRVNRSPFDRRERLRTHERRGT